MQESLSKIPAEIDRRIKKLNMSEDDSDGRFANLLSECKLRTERHFLSEDSEDQDTENASEESDEGTE